ncbi:TIGR02186 family protein [Megalodesulfovibrio paquesii]
MRAIILTLLLTLTVLAAPGAVLAEGSLPLSIDPQHIDIGIFYNGMALAVRGAVPEGAQVVVRFTGAPETVHLKQKGKVFGLLWMNMNSLEFRNVPKVCLLEASSPLKDLGAAGQELSLEGLARGFVIEPAEADRALLVPEFLHLKDRDGLFRQQAGGIILGEAVNGVRPFTLDMAIPSRLSPGTYSVEVFAIKGGQTIAQAATPLDVALVGTPAFIANLAFNHGAWYGILASIIAILAGLAIGMVFQSKEPH